MVSQQEAGGSMQAWPDNTAADSWMVAAVEAVQGITAALEAHQDDVQPLDDADAPNYQLLCGLARQACCQAEGCFNRNTTTTTNSFQSKELDCLSQLSTAALQLSAAVCCNPAVALPLISSGMHTAAMDQLKGAVKSLTNLWTACIAVLNQQQHNQQQEDTLVYGACPGPGGIVTASQDAAWQAVLPGLSASVKHLLHMSITSADFVSKGSTASSQQVPREMCSMSALNLSWANLTRLLVAVPEGMRVQVLQAQDLLQVLQCALQQLHMAVMDLAVQPRERQEVLVRFWLQSVSRLTSAAWEDAAQQALLQLLQLALDVYGAVVEQRAEFAAVQDILQQLLQPRLLACLSSLLSSSTDAATFQNKLDLLLQLPDASISEQQQRQQQCHVKTHVLLVLDVLQSLLPNWPQELIGPACKQLLTWTVNTTGQHLFVAVLGGGTAADTNDCAAGTADADAPGLELMQGVMQGCLVSLTVCWGLLQQEQQQQVELLGAVNRLALSAHPLVSFLARQLLADVIAAVGSRDLAAQELSVLHKLLGAAAAAAAVPGAGWETQVQAEAVQDCLVSVLQVCDEDFAAQWLKQHIMPGLGSSSSSSSGGSWLDAGACTLLAQECHLLHKLVSTAPRLMPVSHAEIEECWTQLWSTAQQVAELLEAQPPVQPPHVPLQQQQQQHSLGSLTVQQADSILVLHQLSCLFSALQAQLQLCSALDASAAAALKQGVVQLALDVLTAVSGGAGCSFPSAHAGMPHKGTSPATVLAAAAHFSCSMAVLRLLAAPGQLAVPDSQVPGLLRVLRGLAAQQQGLHAVLAGVLGNLGIAAADQAFQELFQQLLSSPQWVVRHAAFEAVLQLLRHGGLSTGIVKLLPPGMRSSSTEATPAVINTVKAHLHKQPDPQAQEAFNQHYPLLAAQDRHQLAAYVAACHSTSSTGTPNGRADLSCAGLCHAEVLDKDLQGLQGLLAACSSDDTASAQQPQQGAGAATRLQRPAAEQATMCADAAAGAGGAQALLAQAATATRSLQAAEQALSVAEADARLLLSAASAAARDQSLGADGILLVSKQGAHLVGNVASLVSRLRALQDELSTLRG